MITWLRSRWNLSHCSGVPDPKYGIDNSYIGDSAVAELDWSFKAKYSPHCNSCFSGHSKGIGGGERLALLDTLGVLTFMVICCTVTGVVNNVPYAQSTGYGEEG